jgi:hypothetical protein
LQQSFATLPTINKPSTGTPFFGPISRLTFAALDPLFSGLGVDVAKLTLCATANGSFLKRHPAVHSQKRTSCYWLHWQCGAQIVSNLTSAERHLKLF